MTMTTTTATKLRTAASPFPAKEIEACIRDFLAAEAAVQADLHGTRSATRTVEPIIDSLVFVELLAKLESTIPFALPDSLIQAGGYASVDEVVTDLVPKLERCWAKHEEEQVYEP
jgi:acyl carrier protein